MTLVLTSMRGEGRGHRAGSWAIMINGRGTVRLQSANDSEYHIIYPYDVRYILELMASVVPVSLSRYAENNCVQQDEVLLLIPTQTLDP